MTLPEYIEQTRTTDLVNTVKHAALGLISEIGEVYGVLARVERGDKIDRAERMTAELGDVAWYLARLCDLGQFQQPSAITPKDMKWHAERNVEFLLWVLACFAHGAEGEGKLWRANDARTQWSVWFALCRAENLDPLAVLESNLAKLRDRAARKVLRGDGDHR